MFLSFLSCSMKLRSAEIAFRMTYKHYSTSMKTGVSSFHIETPTVEADVTNRPNLYFKLENMQKSGSFKDRGIGNMIFSLLENGDMKKLVSSSGGNAGHSVATVGENVGVPVDVYVPVTTKPMMIEKIRKRGANGKHYPNCYLCLLHAYLHCLLQYLCKVKIGMRQMLWLEMQS